MLAFVLAMGLRDASATGIGGGITSPAFGPDGSLDILQGGGSSTVWSLDVATGNFQILSSPNPVGSGGAISYLWSGCDYAFTGQGTRTFFSTGPHCAAQERLSDAPAPVGAGAGIAVGLGFSGETEDLVFALRGGNTSDFWAYSISQRTWQTLSNTPAPIGDGGATVEVAVEGGSLGFAVYALRGGGSQDFFYYDIASRAWTVGPKVPASVGAGGSLAWSYTGDFYALRGGGSQDVWSFRNGSWVTVASIPEAVNAGGGLVAVNYGTRNQRPILYAVTGGNSDAVWRYDVGSNTWTHIADVPPHTPSPGILMQPQNQTVVAGETAVFNMAASGNPPLGYQWQFNGTNVSSGSNARLTISNAIPADAGPYRVVVSNADGSVTSVVATLAVTYPPFLRIARQPQGRTVRLAKVMDVLATNLTFSVSAVSTNSPISYQWQFNDMNITDATNSSYILTDVSVFRHGTYQVFVSDAVNSIVSDPANLTVLVAPSVIQPLPSSIVATQGDNITLSVVISGWPPPFGYSWRRMSVHLADVTTSASSNSLTLYDVQPMTDVLYRMVITNLATLSLTNATPSNSVTRITVIPAGDQIPPLITSQPQSQIVTEGTDVTFNVAAVGTPPLMYQWNFNGTNIPGTSNALLLITNAQVANAGNYIVVVTNNFGMATSSQANLKVNPFPPSITSHPQSQTVSAGDAATFNVAATGEPPLSYRWQFNGTNIGGATNSLIMINNAQPANQGDYRVVVSNAGGAVTSAVATLSVTLRAVLSVGVQGQGAVAKTPEKAIYNVGEDVTLTATPRSWFAFTRWGDGPTANPRVITIGTSNNYTAIFSPTTSVETLTFSNVSRTAAVGMPALFVDGGFVVTGAVMRLNVAEISMLTTFPNGSIFYTLDGSTPDFGRKRYSGAVVLRRSATVRAVAYDASFLNGWEADQVSVIVEPTFAVSASTAGGGLVRVSPVSASYRSNSLVTLIATPGPGWTFLQWLGDASGSSATTSVLVLNRDLCAQALFGTTLATTAAGSGVVMVDPAAALYPYGTEARLTAVPQSGNYFGAWGNAVMSGNNPLLFPLTNAEPTVSCAFGALSAGQVALTVLVNGRGRATTNPRGNRFLSNQSVTLTATADADQDFLSWNGDASGTSTNLTVVLAQSKVITANFTKHPRLSLGPCLGRLMEDGFQLTLTGETGARYAIEQSSGLANWSALGSFTNTYGILQVIDAATNDTRRFYRVLEE